MEIPESVKQRNILPVAKFQPLKSLYNDDQHSTDNGQASRKRKQLSNKRDHSRLSLPIQECPSYEKWEYFFGYSSNRACWRGPSAGWAGHLMLCRRITIQTIPIKIRAIPNGVSAVTATLTTLCETIAAS